MKRNEFKHTCHRQETDFKEFYYFQDDLICTQRHKDTKFLLSALTRDKKQKPWKTVVNRGYFSNAQRN